MVADIFITENRDLPIKREIGFVSATSITGRAEAIGKLIDDAEKLGANTLIVLRISQTISDPHFPTNVFYAHGIAVET